MTHGKLKDNNNILTEISVKFSLDNKLYVFVVCCLVYRIVLYVYMYAYMAASTHTSMANSVSASSHRCRCEFSMFSYMHHLSSPPHNLVSSGIKGMRRRECLRAQINSTISTNAKSAKGLVDVTNEPDHLLVLVNGIMGSPSNWKYAEAELNRRLGKKFLIYASSSNTYSKTFNGIDISGKRLADEVVQIVQKTESLKRISFLAHSLGGVIARYAISVLYSPNDLYSGQPVDPSNSEEELNSRMAKIAGLEPINFITLASPHLGVRGRYQLPFLLGITAFEKLVSSLSPLFSGRTGKQMFLSDGESNEAPLLLRMASDCEDGKFISALDSFKCRIIYANVYYDYIVGWRTSSIRRETELPKVPQKYLDGYKHVVNVEFCPPVPSNGPHYPLQAGKVKEVARITPGQAITLEYHEIIEEEMIRGLQQVGWRKVDVNFRAAFWPFFAHNNLQVKNEWNYNAGKGVIAHVADSIKQEELSTVVDFGL